MRKGLKMSGKTGFAGIAAALLAMLWLTGCAVNNNFLRPEDFADRLRLDGVTVEGVREVPGQPFRASSGAAIRVAGSEIGVYKFDKTSRVQQERLKRIAEGKKLFINGLPYPVVVSGSFVFMGLEKNTEKHRILESIRKFK